MTLPPPPPPAPPQPASPGARTKRHRGRVAVLLAGTVAVAVLVAVLWTVGGLRPAPDAPDMRPGQWVDGERVRMRLLTAQVTTQKPGDLVFSQEPGVRYLVITADIENIASEPDSTQDITSSSITAHPQPGKTLGRRGYDTHVNREPTDLLLQPDIPKRVLMSWELGKDAPIPREVTLEINDFVFREDFFSQRKSWKRDPADLLAKVTMPVRRAGPP